MVGLMSCRFCLALLFSLPTLVFAVGVVAVAGRGVILVELLSALQRC